MKKRSDAAFVGLYFIVLSIHLIGHLTAMVWLHTITKPLLMPVLMVYHYYHLPVYAKKSALFQIVIFALFFAWLGDVLLIFSESNPLFFLAGLSAFLFTQILYSISFVKVAVKQDVQWNPVKRLLLGCLLIPGSLLLSLLWPHLGSMKIPVIIYGCVITMMASLSAWAWMAHKASFSSLFFSGALIFLVSDSLLALNKFYSPIPEAGFAIMLTYGLAQFLIIKGFTRYTDGLVVDAKQAPAG